MFIEPDIHIKNSRTRLRRKITIAINFYIVFSEQTVKVSLSSRQLASTFRDLYHFNAIGQ